MTRLNDIYQTEIGYGNSIEGMFTRQLLGSGSTFVLGDIPLGYMIIGLESNETDNGIRIYPTEELLLSDETRPRGFPITNQLCIYGLDNFGQEKILAPPAIGYSVEKQIWVKRFGAGNITIKFIASGLVSNRWNDFLSVLNYSGG